MYEWALVHLSLLIWPSTQTDPPPQAPATFCPKLSMSLRRPGIDGSQTLGGSWCDLLIMQLLSPWNGPGLIDVSACTRKSKVKNSSCGATGYYACTVCLFCTTILNHLPFHADASTHISPLLSSIFFLVTIPPGCLCQLFFFSRNCLVKWGWKD